MAATKLLLLGLCLSVMISVSVSQRFPMYGGGGGGRFGGITPGARLANYCGMYNKEKVDEGYTCNWNVLKKIFEKDKEINHDESMRQLFRMARNGMLCYTEGARIVNVRGPCHAMEVSCHHFAHSSAIDNCWRVSQANPPATARPNPPQAPGGRGI
ncbi:uncharacterized protein LOC105441530 [Strongylocentrotus purpuratus]|uniref:Uncharacterized protein n=1 Tax=Strongylocentrotus purpuratus TaxID=7668 RepID=A0A7M7HFB2_STRPU|nr:uncharacterized protein LOC105441530 [Strongylocentrotus purpuratus]|eukprot:XP_011670983.1 PREDICTED: uncharacterized protein LOC105441530 [Strongylocentrotus purpuratus]